MAPVPSVAEAPPGFLGSIRAFLAMWVALLRTRVEILSTDLEEQRQCLSKIVLLGIASVLCLAFGVLLLTVFVVVLFWDNYRLEVLGGFTLLYLGVGVGMTLLMRSKVRSKPKFLGATLDELAKDFKHLTS